MLTPNDFTEEQQLAIDRLYEEDETMLIAPKGFGKCAVGLTALMGLLNHDVISRVLVISTAQVITQTWDREFKKWDHLKNIDYACLTGHQPAERKRLMHSNVQIVLCNFELLAWLFEEFPDHTFDALMVDEITKLKSVGGVGFKKLRKELKKFKWTCGMTADPVAQDSPDIYGQMLVIDKGKSIGRNQETFKRKYFMQMDFMGYDWEFQPGGQVRLAKALEDVIYKVDGAEYEDSLPELIDHEIEIELSEDDREIYTLMAKDGFVMIDDQEHEAPNEAIVQSKLHQICNGAIYDAELSIEELENGDEKVLRKVFVTDLHDSKIRVVRGLVREIKTPVLIAYQFDFQRKALMAEFNFPVFSAKNSKKVNETMLADWESGKLRGMLVHPKSAGHGLNLQYGPCHTLINMSYFWSADEWDQLLGRLRRRGQASPFVTRYTIVARNTVEDCVMKPRLEDRIETSERFHKYLEDLR